MTTVTFFRKNGVLTAVKANGHAGYKEHGYDIVCAAISTAIQGALLGLTQIAKANVNKQIKDGYLFFEIVGSQNCSTTAIFETMYLTLKDIAEGYKPYIKLEEFNDDEN